MRARNQLCTWRSFVGVSAMSLMVCGVVLGGPRVTKSDAQSDFFGNRARAVEVIPPRDMPRQIRASNELFLEHAEIDPEGLPTVIWEVDDDATYERGGVAVTGSLEATVFSETFDAGVGFFGVLVGTEIGNVHAVGIEMANWAPGGFLTGYDALILQSPAANTQFATVRLSLWDGDPLAFFDTACSAGGVPAVIPGTTGTFTDLEKAGPASCGSAATPIVADPDLGYDPNSGCVGLYRLKVTLPAKTQVNCERVWMAMELLDGCRIAWRIGDQDNGNDLGFMTQVELVYSNVFDPPLTCCGTGAPCTRATSATDCNHSDACTDGTVDTLGTGESDPGGMPPYFVAFNSSVRAATDLRLYGQPVSADDKPENNPPMTDWNIVGNEINLATGGRPVWIDWLVSDWDPGEAADNAHRVKAMQGWMDSASFSSGTEGFLTPYRPACANNAACGTAIGNGSGSECLGGFCSPAQVKGTRPDFIMTGMSLIGPAVDVSTNNLRWVSAVSDGPGASIWKCVGGIVAGKVCDPNVCPDPNAPCNDPATPSQGCNGIPVVIPDGLCQPNHNDRYEATTTLYASADCKGEFEVSLFPTGGLFASNLIDDNNQFFPLLAIQPAIVDCEMGQCCSRELICITDVVQADVCASIDGLFDPDKTCADDCGCTSDDQCDDGNPCTDDICDVQNAECLNPSNVAQGVCCDPDTGNRETIDDNNDCTIDECVPGIDGQGVIQRTNEPEFTACNDQSSSQCDNPDSCTADGVCDPRHEPTTTPCDGDALQCFYNLCDGQGSCDTANDLDVNGVSCMTDDDCIALGGGGGSASTATCTGDGGSTCECVACFTDLPCGDELACYADVTFDVAGDNCYGEGEKVLIDIHVGPSLKAIGGGQFFIEYDPTCLDFQGITTVAPFTTVLAQEVNEAAGTIFWAVGVGLDPDTGEPQPCTLGDNSFGQMSFAKVASCDACSLCYGGVNPRETLLAACGSQSQNESAVCPLVECSKAIESEDQVVIDVPDGGKHNVDCDRRTASVSWDPPTATSPCGTGMLKACTGYNAETNTNLDALCMHGGNLPVGTNVFCATANGGCGTSSAGPKQECWTVVVNEQTSLDVEVQLSPVIVADAMSRCIDFQLYSDCVQRPLAFSAPLMFGGLFDHVGHFNDSIKIPDSGQWICITARDQQHTLRSCDFLECVDGSYVAVFKGDPFFGGNWLIGGNLDAWKKDNPNAGHDVINILDFGQYISYWGKNYGGANTSCDKTTGNADINGDGVVDGLDFAFISMNFGADSKDCCCPGSVAGNRVMLTEVSVLQLRQWGMGDLVVADLNEDGLLNTDDMAAFMQGTTPDTKGDDGRKGSSLRSSRSR